MQELVHQNHFAVYSNTFMVFEYLCNRVNIRANRVFVSALVCIQFPTHQCINECQFSTFEGLPTTFKGSLNAFYNTSLHIFCPYWC